MAALGSVLFSLLALVVTLGVLVTVHEYGHFRAARWAGVQVERFSVGMGKVLFSWRGGPDPKNPQAPPTEFAISLLPLGGYVKMLGEQDPASVGTPLDAAMGQPELAAYQRESALFAKPVYQRAVIFAAGPVANFLLAILLYWVMFMTGVSGLAPVVGRVDPGSPAAAAGLRGDDEIVAVNGRTTATWQEVRQQLLDRLGESGVIRLQVRHPESTSERRLDLQIERWLAGQEDLEPLTNLGIVPYHLYIPARLESVLPDGRAAAAGLQADDLILAASGTEITDWAQWLKIVQANPERDLDVTIQRAGTTLSLVLRPAVRLSALGEAERDAEGREQGYIGAAVALPDLPDWMNRSTRHNPLAAIPQALQETWDNCGFVLASLKKMLLGLISVKNLSGPITIAQVAGETASIGFEYYIGFLAVLSISLGIFNLLPIPILDGGHLLYCAIEAVLRRPVPRQVQDWGLQLGLLLVASFMFIALYNDVSRLL
jgi:regulator of sigma E protease